jgi:hypothetical protein
MSTALLHGFVMVPRQCATIVENTLQISRLPEFNELGCTLLWNTAGGAALPKRKTTVSLLQRTMVCQTQIGSAPAVRSVC